MANKFEMQITAVDRATAVINRVNASMSEMGRPITENTKRMTALGSAIGKNPIAKKIGEISKSGLLLSRNLGAALPQFNALTGAGAIAGVTALAMGLERAAMASAKMAYSNKRGAVNAGVSVTAFQELNAAGKLADLPDDAMGSSLVNLRNALTRATLNDPSALTALRSLGVNPATATTESALNQISRVAASGKLSPTRLRDVLSMVGVSDIAPLLQMGPYAIQRLRQEARSSGVIDSARDIANKQKVGDDLARLHMGVSGVWNGMTNNAADAAANGSGFGDFMLRVFKHDQYMKKLNDKYRPAKPLNFPGLSAMTQRLSELNSSGVDTLSGVVTAMNYQKKDPKATFSEIDALASRTGLNPVSHLDLTDPKTDATLLQSMLQYDNPKAQIDPAAFLAAVTQALSQAQVNVGPIQVDVQTGGGKGSASAHDAHGRPVPARVGKGMPLNQP